MVEKRNTLIGIVLSVLLLISGACNFPGMATDGSHLPSEALRQTLSAYATSAPTRETMVVLPVGTLPPTPGVVGTPASTSTPLNCGQLVENGVFFLYCAQSGDTLGALGARFDLEPGEIISEEPIPETGFIAPGQVLYIPNTLESSLYGGILLPDSEVLNSPTAADFDTQAYIQEAGGFLSTYSEQVDLKRRSSAEIIQLVADEFSISPRLLLAFLEYRSGWVMGQPTDPKHVEYPIGFHASGQKGLYKELAMVGTHFTIGYYGWRSGEFSTLNFRDSQPGAPQSFDQRGYGWSAELICQIL